MASYSMIVMTLLLCGFLGHTNSQGDADKNPYKVFNVWDIPNSKITQVSNPNVTAMPSTKDINNIVKQKCDINGGAGTFENVERATKEAAECVENFFLAGMVSEEMAKYALTEDLHFVFKTYCPNTPAFKKCLLTYIAAVESCLDPQEKDNIIKIEDVIDALLSYVCYKDGEHIVQFIAAAGPECLRSKQQEIMQCVNTTLSSYSPPRVRNVKSSARSNRYVAPVAFRAKDCMLATTLQSCIVRKLEECSNPTPADTVDSIFNIILRATPCKRFVTGGSAASTSINLLAMGILFLVFRLI